MSTMEMPLRAWATRAAYGQIVVPLDGSHLAESVLPDVEMLARLTGAKVILLRAHTGAEAELGEGVATVFGAGPSLAARAAERVTRHEVERYLDSIAARLRDAGIEVETARRQGAPSETIVQEAVERQADLIAMTTHGRGGVGRVVRGSVADDVLHHARCPVLLVRAA